MSSPKPVPAHELGVECVGLFGLPHSLFDHSGTGEDVPFVARCYAASFLAGSSSRGDDYARVIMVPHAERLAPYGITFYDHELMHNPAKLGCSESYHAFVGTCESGRQFYFHCFTRKTIMPRSDRYSLLRTQLMATTLLCGCDDQSGEALSRIPLYDTTIICVVTSECCMATMRRVLTAFAAAVPTSESFDDVACMKLFHQLQEVRNIPFRVVHGFDVLGSPKAAFEPVDDTDVDPDALLVVLPCVVIGTDTICLRPQFAHSWERVPYSGVSIPSGISSVESSPGLQPKVVSPRASDGSGSDMASRRSHPTPIPSSRTSFPFSSKRVWACPTCHAKAFRSKSHHTPTHWCLACRRCNICVASGHEEGRDRTPYLLRPCEYPLPHQDVDLSILLSRLDAHNVIAVIIALMCDRMVLVVSEDIGILADVVSGLLSMLHPFKSERQIIPIGFKSFPTRDMLDYPYPAIMATTPSFLFTQEIGEMTNALNASQSSFVSSVVSDEPQVPITARPVTPTTPVQPPPPPPQRSWWQNLLFKMSPTKPEVLQGGQSSHSPAHSEASSPAASSVRTPTSRRKSTVLERHTASKLPLQSNESTEERARRLLARYDCVVPDQVVVVDLDCNAVSPHATSLDVQLPPRLLYRIYDAVLRYGNVYGAAHPDWKQPDPVLSRSVTEDERKIMEARFEIVRRQAEASLQAAASKVMDAAASASEAGSPFVLSSVPGHLLSSASKPPRPPALFSPTHSPRGTFESPATRPTPQSSGRHSAFDFQVSPIGECSPLPALAPVTDDALNSDDELSDPMKDVGGSHLVNLVESFPWQARVRLDALERLKYVVPTQLLEEDISNTARTAVQALLVKIVLGTPSGVPRAPSHDVLMALEASNRIDGDTVLDVIGLSVDRVRMAVLSVMVSLFRSYRMYIVAPSAGNLTLHHRRRTVDSDADVITTSVLPIAGHIPVSISDPSPSSHPTAPTRRLPAYNDVFLKDEFLAEQTHEESRELLRYCVTQFMPFPNFVSERCQPATHPDLFDRMCFDSMALRATMYDHIMKTRLEDEVLVLCRRKFEVLSEASMHVGWDTTLSSSEWLWKPVLLTIKSGECLLRLTETSPEYEDAREEYVRALLQFHAKTGTYDAVASKKGTCERLLKVCPSIDVPLLYARTSIIVPSGEKLPRAGPLHYIELQTAPAIDESPEGGLRLLLATESPGAKRQWIMHFKSRLRSPKYVETLRTLYLCSGGGDDNGMAAFM